MIHRTIQIDPKTLEIDIHISFNDKQLSIKHLLSMLDIENILPPKHPNYLDPFAIYEHQEKMERRRKFVEMLSAQIAWEFTIALTGEENLVSSKI